ncbi:hypothetical protein BT96DRAFT_972656 [Gymnopus androsaceus JB14]|uniref:Uncharacterized protein n=1 Tax=Gymnopus androsaceus JB14 TaxID=1447944 RepID=A0A6A4I3J8_9AGAR|nr:hypothetical protein BT96DRAFT_972656 [Gymnopus androsaceus JB14]
MLRWLVNTDFNDTTILGGSTAFVPIIVFVKLFPSCLISIRLFFTLSAYLFQATADNTYLNAAQDSGAFMVDVINITSVNNGVAAISANDSVSCGDVFGTGNFRIDQVGVFMEGLAVLPGDVSFGKQNISVDTLRSEVVNITLTTNIYCNSTGGIIQVESDLGNTALVQGLGVIYHAISLSGPADLVTYIGNFLSVQYNSIVTAATNPNSNIYAGSWTGPPVTEYDPTNQTFAISGLVNGAQVSSSTNSSSTNTGGSSAKDSTTAHTNDAGPIAGGIVGGLALLAGIALVIFYATRHRRRIQRKKLAMNKLDIEFDARPLTVTYDQEEFYTPRFPIILSYPGVPNPSVPALSTTGDSNTENHDASTGSAGLHDIKRPQIEVVNVRSSGDSRRSIDPAAVTGEDSAEGRPEEAGNAPPAYETPDR